MHETTQGSSHDERSAAKVKQSLTSADSGKTTDPAQTTAAVANAARDPRGVGNGPVAGRFVLFEPDGDGEFYVTSWDTWDEAEAAFPIQGKLVLRDDEMGREWLAGAPYEWEAAR